MKHFLYLAFLITLSWCASFASTALDGPHNGGSIKRVHPLSVVPGNSIPGTKPDRSERHSLSEESGMVASEGFSVEGLQSRVGKMTIRDKYSDPDLMGEFMINVGGRKITTGLSDDLQWDKMPTKSNDKIPGMSENSLLDAYEEMYTFFMKKEDANNAAQALWHGSQVATFKEGSFFMFLDDLGIEGENPSLEHIKAVLEAKFPR